MNQTILAQKQQTVTEISDKLKNAASMVIFEYRGLSVKEITELRATLHKEDIEMTVFKNSMVRRAVDAAGFDELNNSLTGPNALTFSSDAVAPSRILVQFAKKHEKLVNKTGIVDSKVVGPDQIKELATLPNKEGMYSMMLGCLQAPLVKLALTIKALAEKEPAEASAAPAAEPAPETEQPAAAATEQPQA